ncbi:MAG: DUF3365 domain-containing protein [Nitrospina sp.]|jgi:hypothetical protein|nr:DUF3365 domain-containing protein [Nitrospina sp.]MBT3509495.1 DUF3365 domain-containing protein [Nitrospina sp.]MBT3877096.1 DUF3365 domain-containing protein [Nitrospina sp.]MBT4050025.1 DUF3365 domain-containing protein [Nitrospina sp.]MBT4558506.1 DUF3365 domain-containing protein [Nitrospina sp.]
MRSFAFCSVLLFLLLPTSAQSQNKGIPAALAADLIHSVIEAGRTTYSKKVVEHLARQDAIAASENWEHENTLPLPAQFLSMSSKISNSHRVGMKYRLMSLWPINKHNSPRSQNEKLGLEEVVKNPKKPFTWIVPRDGRWYFEAIYPDIAISKTCSNCHNNHPNSPKTDFEKGSVMGGIIIDLPLGRRTEKNVDEKLVLAPEVVADYVHSVLESDRTVYAKHIVNRLEDLGIMHSKEKWKNDKALMLPAQFLLNSAEEIETKKVGLNFRLLSLYPINPQNRPANEFEQNGLESVEVHPVRPYIKHTKVGRKKYFQAIYPDIAVTRGCVNCHNGHPNSPKKDFVLDDVMGGILVSFRIP